MIKDIAIPTHGMNYVRGFDEDDEGDNFKRWKSNLFYYARQLATLILAFAQVVNLESCATFPYA